MSTIPIHGHIHRNTYTMMTNTVYQNDHHTTVKLIITLHYHDHTIYQDDHFTIPIHCQVNHTTLSRSPQPYTRITIILIQSQVHRHTYTMMPTTIYQDDHLTYTLSRSSQDHHYTYTGSGPPSYLHYPDHHLIPGSP